MGHKRMTAPGLHLSIAAIPFSRDCWYVAWRNGGELSAGPQPTRTRRSILEPSRKARWARDIRSEGASDETEPSQTQLLRQRHEVLHYQFMRRPLSVAPLAGEAITEQVGSDRR